MKKAFPLLALLVISLAGCDSKSPASTSAGTSTGGSSSATAVKLPDELKNDAYEYYGLGNDKPVRLEIVNGEGAAPQIGTRTFELQKVEDGKATFVQRQGGALVGEGDITLSLENDGLYVMSSTQSKLKPHSLEMPSKLEPGGGWKDHTEMDQAGQNIVLDNDLKIVRKERIATKGGTFDNALYITSTGKGTIANQPVTLTTKHWYVRGVGPVKQIVEVTTKGKPTRTITIQLAAPESAETSTAPTGTSAAETKK
ncbi:hypothetical protein EON82_00020 [bacterium]|nr:MAG: hypothetical protein EON82_00020 [bacterium]